MFGHHICDDVFSRCAVACSAIAFSWLFLGGACFAQDEVIAPNWQVYRVGEGTKPAFDFDSAGRVHVMGMTEVVDGVAWYATAGSAAGPWQPDTIETGYFYGPGDLRVGPDGTAHMAWHDHDAQDGVSISVDFAGNVRKEFVRTFGNHDGWDNSLAFDENGVLFQSSVDPSSFGATTSLSVASLRETGWESEVVTGSGSFMYGFNTSLAFDALNEPHVLFTAAEHWTGVGDLKHAFRTSDGWQVESVVSGGIRGRFPSLAFDRQGRAHAAWLDINSEDPRSALVRHGMLENGRWTIADVGELDDVELGFSGGRKQVSIAIDSGDNVHIAYGDRRIVNYGTLETNGWRIETLLESDEPLYNGLVVLRLNPVNDLPAIAFWQPDDVASGIVRLLSRAAPSRAGDVNLDGRVDELDIALLAEAIRQSLGDLAFDVDRSGVVDDLDLRRLVESELNTYFGDANLDGEFNSGDLVTVFKAGEYEDDIAQNSNWATGDWNGDADFGTSDLILAFQAGGFEQGPREVVSAVPEPSGATLLTISLVLVVNFARRRLG